MSDYLKLNEIRSEMEDLHDLLIPSHRGKICPFIRRLWKNSNWMKEYEKQEKTGNVIA